MTQTQASDDLAKARGKLMGRRQDIVRALASKYNRERTVELVFVSQAIKLIDELIGEERPRTAPPPVHIGVSAGRRSRGPHESDD
jgi:hypothetical protein